MPRHLPKPVDDPQSWRSGLSNADEAEVAQWVAQLGLRRVARIIAALADASGERGRTVQPDSKLLLDMARLKKRNRSRGNHSIATEIVGTVQIARQPAISPDNLIAKLRDEFNERQHAWMWLIDHQGADEPERDRRNRPPSPSQTRTLGRLIEVLPEELNAYGALIEDAKRRGDDGIDLVNKCGRKVCERLLEERIREQTDSPFIRNDRLMPRDFFDLIADDLAAHAAEQEGRK